MSEKLNLQDSFLNNVRKTGAPVTIHIINGFTLKDAVVKSFDSYCMLVECEDKQLLIYKHAVSTVTVSAQAVRPEDSGKAGAE